MRQPPEQDELLLLEEAEPGDVDYPAEDQHPRERRRRSSAAAEIKRKRMSGSDVSGLHRVQTQLGNVHYSSSKSKYCKVVSNSVVTL